MLKNLLYKKLVSETCTSFMRQISDASQCKFLIRIMADNKYDIDDASQQYSQPIKPIGCSPSNSGKAIIFRQKLIFCAEARSQKMKKKYFLSYLLNEKMEFIPSVEIKCPKSGIFTDNY